jgi:hypothetical protein
MRPQNKSKAKGKVHAELEVKKRRLEEEIAEGLQASKQSASSPRKMVCCPILVHYGPY